MNYTTIPLFEEVRETETIVDELYYLYKEYDGRFNTEYDFSLRYLVNFSQIKDLPIHRWYYYQEGYSSELIKHFLKKYNLTNSKNKLVDPFAGSGTTLLVGKELGMLSIGFEINPFSSFMIEGKVCNYSESELNVLRNFMIKDLTEVNTDSLYEFSMIEKLFDKKELTKIENLKYLINEYSDVKIRNILKIALLCILQDVSYYKKAGNGLKRKLKINEKDTYILFENKLQQIISDLTKQTTNIKPKIYNDSCLNLEKYELPKFNISFFSPPYANCFDYYEVYKTELWLGEFVNSYGQLGKLRKEALTSNLNANLNRYIKNELESELFTVVFDNLKQKELWNKKILIMLEKYFEEMNSLFKKLYNKLEDKGYCFIVIGNSAYGGITIPTDLIFAELLENVGFTVKEIVVARNNETSSQQYDKIGNLVEYVRESIVVVQK